MLRHSVRRLCTQSSELRVAPLGLRVGAGVIDLGISAFCGIAVGLVAQFAGGVSEVTSVWSAASTSVSLFALRDAIGREGNASIGKAFMDLEVTLWDGQLATREQCVLRGTSSLLWMGLWFPQQSVVAELLLLAVVFEVGSFFVTEDGRKIGDYMSGTRVTMQQENRDGRMLDAVEGEEMIHLEREIGQLSGDLLSRLQSANGAHSYNSVAGEVLAMGRNMGPRTLEEALAQAAQVEHTRAAGVKVSAEELTALRERASRLPIPGETLKYRGRAAEKQRIQQREETIKNE